VRRSDGSLDVLARTGAGINKVPGAQLIQCGAVKTHPFALVVGAEFAADIRPLAPYETEPAQILQHRLEEFHFETHGIHVFIAQNQRAAMGAGAFLRGPERSRMAEMQIARRRRRKTSAIVKCAIHGDIKSFQKHIRHGENELNYGSLEQSLV
jgi:hypothetical protein